MFDLVGDKDKHESERHQHMFNNCKVNYNWDNLRKSAILFCCYGLNVDQRDINGMTVLHLAAFEKNQNSVKFTEFFCQHQYANPNFRTEAYPDHDETRQKTEWQKGSMMFEQTPLHIAMRAKKREGPMHHLTKPNSERGKKSMENALAELSQNQEKIVDILLKNGAEMNLCDQFGNNFLHYVAARGLVKKFSDSIQRFDRELRETMLEHDDDDREILFVDKKNGFGDTPLIMAMQLVWDDDEVELLLPTVKKLHEHGADLNHKNEFGYSALLISKMRGLRKVTEFLESNGAVLDLEKEDLYKIVRSYGFDEYRYFHSNETSFKPPSFFVKSTCEYLRKLARMDLGRFSEEYEMCGIPIWMIRQLEESDSESLSDHFRISVEKFSSAKKISEFISADPDFKEFFVSKLARNGRIFKEDLCLICLTEASEKIFLPCGHEAICESCLSMSKYRKCPLCKQEIEIAL